MFVDACLNSSTARILHDNSSCIHVPPFFMSGLDEAFIFNHTLNFPTVLQGWSFYKLTRTTLQINFRCKETYITTLKSLAFSKNHLGNLNVGSIWVLCWAKRLFNVMTIFSRTEHELFERSHLQHFSVWVDITVSRHSCFTMCVARSEVTWDIWWLIGDPSIVIASPHTATCFAFFFFFFFF
jgi:hypothetical protein